MIAPFSRDVQRFDEIPGVSLIAAQEPIAESGVDVTRFPTAAHLVPWAKFAPIDHNSAGKKRGGATGKDNPWLGGILGEIVAKGTANQYLPRRTRPEPGPTPRRRTG